MSIAMIIEAFMLSRPCNDFSFLGISLAFDIMDRIVIQCKQCTRPLSALPTMKSRKCAACGATTKILAFQREQAIPIGETAEKVAVKAKKTQFDPGKTTVVKRRAARPITDEEGDA